MGTDERQYGRNGIGSHLPATGRSPEAKKEQVTTGHAIARWRAADNLIWTQFDDADDWLVYNSASGDIHLLSDAAHRLWILTSETALTSEELVTALAYGSSPTEEFIAAAMESLTAMDRAGLIRIASRS